MPTNPMRLSVREKLGYGLSDAATNFFFMSMIFYQQRYYTDVVGLASSVVGFLFIGVRLVDAIADPVIGALADRTHTRWGKFRPWLLFTALPFGLLFWLSYSVPNVSGPWKLVYASVTYLLLMVAYSCNNTPYAALTGVMTAEPAERTSISCYRLFLAIVGQLIITTFVLTLVAKIGAGDAAKGWSRTIGIFAVAIVIFNVVAFAVTRERVQPDPQQKLSLKHIFSDVLTCRPWLVMFGLTLLVFTMLPLRGSAFNYYFGYYLDQPRLAQFIVSIGLGSSVNEQVTPWQWTLDLFGLRLAPDGSNAAAAGFSLFNMLSILLQICGILFSSVLANRFGKKRVFIVGLGLTALVTGAVILVPPQAIGMTFLLGGLWGLCYGPTIPLLWSMIADVPDYAEWQTSRRATGFAYAGIVFALKAGLGLGGALGGWLLAAYGYVANSAQTPLALRGIRLSASIFPAAPLLIGVLVLLAYPITRELGLRIRDELAERRKRYIHGVARHV